MEQILQPAAPKENRARTIVYWIATVLVSLMMLASAFAYLTTEQMATAFTHLGYPAYFRVMLATAKFLGVAALLVPAFPILKEWAYAGFTFTFIGAIVSHLASGDGSAAVAPFVALLLLTVSYFLRPSALKPGRFHSAA